MTNAPLLRKYRTWIKRASEITTDTGVSVALKMFRAELENLNPVDQRKRAVLFFDLKDLVQRYRLRKGAPQEPAFEGYTLENYLEGENVPEAWVDIVAQRKAVYQPSTVYRLQMTTKKRAQGKTLLLTRKIFSTALTEKAAIYAGTSYLHDTYSKEVLTAWKEANSLVLVEIHNPRVCISFQEIIAHLRPLTRVGCSYILRRSLTEQECIVAGRTTAQILRIIPWF